MTSTPAVRAAAATSRPIHPAPMMSTRDAVVNVSRIRSLSPTLRKYSTPSASAPGSGRRRGTDPVASNSLP